MSKLCDYVFQFTVEMIKVGIERAKRHEKFLDFKNVTIILDIE